MIAILVIQALIVVKRIKILVNASFCWGIDMKIHTFELKVLFCSIVFIFLFDAVS